VKNTEPIDQVKADVLEMFDILFPMLSDEQKETKGAAQAFALASKYRPIEKLEKLTSYKLVRREKLGLINW
jgi:hypothetical protein